MKYKKEEVSESYKEFLEADLNQQDILLQLRLAIEGFIALSSFKGVSASSAKDYFEDIHMAVVDTFGIALMDLEIRFLALMQDFENTVDDSDTAILDESFIAGKKDDLTVYRTTMQLNDDDAANAISSIKNDIYFQDLPFDTCDTSIKAVVDKMQDIVGSMYSFNSNHKSDLDDLNSLFPLFDQAFSFMDTVIGPNNITFPNQCTTNLDWLEGMSDYRFKAFLNAREVDPELYETVYSAVIVNCGLDVFEYMISQSDDIDLRAIYLLLNNGLGDSISVLADMSEGTAAAYEFILLYRSNLKFMPVVEDGSVFIKITTRGGQVLSNAERIAALQKAEAPIPTSKSTLTKLFYFEKGLCVWKNGRSYSELFGKMNSWDEAVDMVAAVKAGDFSKLGNLSKLSNLMKGLKTTGKVISYVGYSLTLGLDVYDSFYDERTGKLSNNSFDGAELAAGFTIDGGIIATSAIVGATIGSAVPVAGTAIGALVGAGVGLALNLTGSLIQWGEPKKSLLEHAKDGLTDAYNAVGNWFSKVFW